MEEASWRGNLVHCMGASRSGRRRGGGGGEGETEIRGGGDGETEICGGGVGRSGYGERSRVRCGRRTAETPGR